MIGPQKEEMETAEPSDSVMETEQDSFEVESLRPFYYRLSTGLGFSILTLLTPLAVFSHHRLSSLKFLLVLAFLPMAVAALVFLFRAFFKPRTETIAFTDDCIDLWRLYARNKRVDHPRDLKRLGYAVFHTTPLFSSELGWNTLENSLFLGRFTYLLHALLTYVLLAPVTLPMILITNHVAKRMTGGNGFMVCAVGYEPNEDVDDVIFSAFTAKYRCFYIAPTNAEDAARMVEWFDRRGVPCRFNRYPWSPLLRRRSEPSTP